MKKIYVVLREKCKPSVCNDYSCIKSCPLVKEGKKNVIRVRSKTHYPTINERRCIACGICQNVCPVKAISSVSISALPKASPTHQFSTDSFQLFGLPQIRPGAVTGLLGPNGIGKTTLLEILSGAIRPNGGDLSGKYEQIPNLDCTSIPGMKGYLRDVTHNKISVSYKKQALDELLRSDASVDEFLCQNNTYNEVKQVLMDLEISNLTSRKIKQLSGGELQRLALANALLKEADVYLIDEPCTYLDVRQRLRVAYFLRQKAINEEKAVFVSEHDIAMLDFQSDFIHILHGEPHTFGIISRIAYSPKKGINAFLRGRLREENIIFRSKTIRFRRLVKERSWDTIPEVTSYKAIEKRIGDFKLYVEPGKVHRGETIGILGENGLGKTTFAKVLAEDPRRTKAGISYKPQVLHRIDMSVETFLSSYAKSYIKTSENRTHILRPLGVWKLLNEKIDELSGGELQRTFLAGCLSKKADLYIIDEGSAFLDVEERLKATRVIRHICTKRRACVMAIEHDIQIADAIADRIMVFVGEPGVQGEATSPLSKKKGMNLFLRSLDVTFRRDEETGRARINKKDSQIDRNQRELGEYYYTRKSLIKSM